MPMSGSFRRSEAASAAAPGFTLLELLIVLALVAMVAALAAPGLQRTYDAVSRSSDRSEVRRQLSRLPLLARERAQPIVASPEDGQDAFAALLDLPEGWRVRAATPLRVEASGVCHPAQVQVEGGGGTETWTLDSPTCAIDDGT